MTSAIKPPSASPVGGAGAPPESAARPLSGSGESFRSELEKAAPVAEVATGTPTVAQTGAAQAHAAQTTVRAELLRAISEDLRAGRIDSRQAIDRLVERALSAGPAAVLPPARRAELEALLRSTLAEDPTLASMQRELAREV